ncbi:hypothetical protein [Brevundimonas sp.]|uniref:hypothetical protein n=1 Tax=Brevundimonas sp. TaxID=1871086 RepID=UPI002EDB0D20
MKRLSLVLAGAVLALAACDAPQPGSAPSSETKVTQPAFVHTLSGDVSGYFIPLWPIAVGDWRLHHLFLGQPADFTAWEGGGKSGPFAPVMIEFENTAGTPVQSELGESLPRSRVLPSTYQVTDGRVRFSGRSADLGQVSFDGRLDQDALATARRNLGDEGRVVSGTLKVGDRTFDGVQMRWWAGD